MATKASGTLVLIIEKQHVSWGLMVTDLPGLELHFWCQLRIASAKPVRGHGGGRFASSSPGPAPVRGLSTVLPERIVPVPGDCKHNT